MHADTTMCSPPSLPPPSRVRDCSIEATCNLCLGQEGTWSLGSASGQQTSYPATHTRYVLQVSFSGQEQDNSWQWWMGRLTFMDRILSRFSVEYLISQCILESPAATDSDSESDDPSFRSGLASPSDSITSSLALSIVTDVSYTAELGLELETAESAKDSNVPSESEDPLGSLPASCAAAIEKNLLMQVGYFASRATHMPHRKLGRLARKVIIKIAKVLRDDPSSLQVVHDVVGRCHRSQAEGLLDRVLQARESTYDPPTPRRGKRTLYTDSQKKGEGPVRAGRSPAEKGDNLRRPSSTARERSTSPSSRGQAPPPPTDDTHTPLASSSLKSSAAKRDSDVKVRVKSGEEKVRGHKPGDGRVGIRSGSDEEVKVQRGGEEKVRVESGEESRGRTEHEGSTNPLARPVSREGGRRLGRQKSRGGGGGGDGNASATEEFIPSDESFQSALSELDVLDCSADTLMPPEEGFVGGATAEEEESSASNSQDSRKSPGSRKHNTSSGSSVEKGVEPVGGFHNKPGYLK